MSVMLTEEELVDQVDGLDCRRLAEAFNAPRYWLLSPSLYYLEKVAEKKNCDFTRFLVSTDPEVKGLALALTSAKGYEMEALALITSERDSPAVIGAIRYLSRFAPAEKYALSLLESSNLRVIQEAFTYLDTNDREILAEILKMTEPIIFNIKDDFLVESAIELMRRAKELGVVNCENLFSKISYGIETRSRTAVRLFADLFDECLAPLIPQFVDAVEATGAYEELLKLASKRVVEIGTWLPSVIKRLPKLTSYDVDVIAEYVTNPRLPQTIREAVAKSLVERIARDKLYHLVSPEALKSLLSAKDAFHELLSLSEEDSRTYWNAALLRGLAARLLGEDASEYISKVESLFPGKMPEWLERTLKVVSL
ncbi:MAG: hypothetical protein RQ863_01110 [Sulfolobales archaeon]|nr:hypothetical protein [Sulfolobales archaeon]